MSSCLDTTFKLVPSLVKLFNRKSSGSFFNSFKLINLNFLFLKPKSITPVDKKPEGDLPVEEIPPVTESVEVDEPAEPEEIPAVNEIADVEESPAAEETPEVEEPTETQKTAVDAEDENEGGDKS